MAGVDAPDHAMRARASPVGRTPVQVNDVALASAVDAPLCEDQPTLRRSTVAVAHRSTLAPPQLD